MDQQIQTSNSAGVVAGRARGGRPSQQDDLICLFDASSHTTLLVLADGMGGDGAGEIASDGVIATARQMWEQGDWREQPGAMFLEALCQRAHAELRRRGQALAQGKPHSTIVAALIRDDRLCWVHVGDSRLYHFQGLRCLVRTEDHSLSQLKVRRGELAPEQVATDVDQHKLLRGLGGAEPPKVDHGCATLGPGQTLALCSDGVWEQLSTAEIARFASDRDQPSALHSALTLAVERGGEAGDNVALILFRIGWLDWLTQRLARRSSNVA
jgi:serine/threonine protein phosphatase PrpC